MNEEKKSKAGAIVAVVALVVIVAAAAIAYTAFGSGSATSSSSSVLGASASSSASTASSSGSASPASGSGHWDAPDIAALPVTDQDGNETTLGAVGDGRVTVINVWATWCPYCVDEMQDFQRLYDKYGSDVQFVMLDAANSSREVAQAHDYVEEQDFTFPVYYDMSGKVQRYFAVRGYPTTIVIGADGQILANNAGRINAQSFDKGLSSLL